MRRSLRRVRPVVASFVAGATLAAYSVVSLPIPSANAAASPEAGQVLGLLDQLEGFVPGMANVGALSQRIPSLGVSPGQALGLGDLLKKADDELDLGGVTDVDSLVSAINGKSADISGNRHVAFTASKAGATGVTFGLTTTKTVGNASLDVAGTTPIKANYPTFTFTSSGGVSLKLSLSLSFTLNYVAGAAAPGWISSPSVSGTVSASVPNPSAVLGGIGILGVKLADGTSFGLNGAVTATFADPNNDGRLYFDEPGGASTSDGELSAAGAGAGLVTAALTGSVNGNLVFTKADSGGIVLPDINATVGITGDLAAGTVNLTYDSNAFDAVRGFLTLTTRDLASGLASAVSTVMGLENATGVKLPFMRGSVSDAVGALSALGEYLAVPDAPTGVDPGPPVFTSVQDLLGQLKARVGADGTTFTVPDPTYDAATQKLSMPITLSRLASKGSLTLNPKGTATSGSAGTYTATTFKDSGGKAFPATVQGRQILAGTSSAVIESVSGDGLTLTLSQAPVKDAQGNAPNPDVRWVGGIPPAGTAYSISADDPKTGAIELGNALSSNANGAIKNANAKIAQASVTPAFSVSLPLVLDLSDPTTGDCDPYTSGNQSCPRSVTRNGITQVISALPLTADRVKLHVDGFDLTADADISTAVDVDATVGFLGVKVKGQLKACTLSSSIDDHCVGTTSTDHLLTLGLKGPSAFPTADLQGDVSFRGIVEALTAAINAGTPDSVLDFSAKGRAYGALTVEVPGAADFFGGSPSATVDVFMDDITHPEAVHATPGANIGSLGSFNLDPNDPMALFSAVLAGLQTLQGAVGKLPGSAALDKDIPVVGKSFNDIVGSGASNSGSTVTYDDIAAVDNPEPTPDVPALTKVNDTAVDFDASYLGRTVKVGAQQARVIAYTSHSLTLKPAIATGVADGTAYTTNSELQGLIDTLSDAPSANLQELLTLLAAQLGNGSTTSFGVKKSTGAGIPDKLRIGLDWKRDFVTQSPFKLDFAVPGLGNQSLVGATGSGRITTTVGGEIKLSLLIPLNAATVTDPGSGLLVEPDKTSVKATVDVNGNGVYFAGNLGPFKAELGNSPADPQTQLRAGFGVSLAGSGSPGDEVPFGDFLSGITPTVTGTGVSCSNAPSSTDLVLCANFPVKINGTAVGGTPDSLSVRLPLNTSDLPDSLDPFGDAVDGHERVELPGDLSSVLSAEALNLFSFGDGLSGYLTFAENSLRTASFDGKLPLVGKDLQGGADFVGKLRTDLESLFADATQVPVDPNAGQIRKFVKTTLKSKLPTVSDAITVDVTCGNGGLQPAAAPTIEPQGAGTGTTYKYRIVALTKVDEQLTPTTTGDESTISFNADLDATNWLKVSWPSVQYADQYYVLRAIGDGGYKKIATVTDPVFEDHDETTAGEDYQDVAADKVPCPDATPGSQLDGFTVQVSLGQGNPTATGCAKDTTLPAEQQDCATSTLPLDFGLPGLSLKATDDSDGVTTKVGWRLDLKLVLSRAKGFYVDTQDGQPAEFRVGLAVSVPEGLQARVAFINISADDNHKDTSEFAGLFSLDLHDSDKEITLDELVSPDIVDKVTPTLEANVDINLHLKAEADSALPGISADFVLTWQWDSGDEPDDKEHLHIAFNNVKLEAGEFLGKVIKPIIEQVVAIFKPIQPVIDTLFERIPVLSDLSEAVGGSPITIATLATTFSTLAGGPDLTPFLEVLKNIRDLVKALSASCTGGDPCLNVGSFNLLEDKVVDTSNSPSTGPKTINEGPGFLPNTSLLTDLNNTVNGGKKIDQNGYDAAHPGFSFPFLEDPKKIFDLLTGGDVTIVKFDSGPLTLGFDFQQSFGPVYAPPPVNIVVGGGASVTMRIVAGFDTYGIRTAIEKGKVDATVLDSLFFYTADEATGKPIPVVQFTGYLQAGASVSLVVVEVGVVGGVKLTINFYWNDPNNDGKFRFSEFLAAALSNPICLFNVGGELSLFIKVFITLGISPFSVSFDFELVNVTILSFNLKPDCAPPPPKLGGVKGDTLVLFAGEFGGKAQRSPDYDGDYPFTNHGGADDEKWVVRQHAMRPHQDAVPAQPDPDGPGPKQAIAAQPAKDEEPAKIVVTALGISETFDDPNGTTIKNIVFQSRATDTGNISLTFNGGDKDTPFTKNVIVRTGAGTDNIRAGIGNATIDAGAGKDQVSTFERTDLNLDPDDPATPRVLVSGGAGPDSLTVGNGRDTVLGDKSVVFGDVGDLTVRTVDDPTTSDDESFDVTLSGVLPTSGATAGTDPSLDTTVADAAGYDDQIAAGLGGSTVYGNQGNDKIGTANDNPQATANPLPANPSRFRAYKNVLVGGNGSDSIKSGSASDDIFTGYQTVIGEDGRGEGDDAATSNSVDTGTGSDKVYGSLAKDFVTTHSTYDQVATAFGGDNEDVIIGGEGQDALYGGPGDDYLVAGPATVTDGKPVTDELTPSIGTARAVTQVPLPTTPAINKKLLVGGGGSDRIYGVNGPADIYGDHTGVVCTQQSNPVSKQLPENPVTMDGSNNDAADLILGGAGVDTINAGGGDDFVRAYGNTDAVCGSGGNDTLFAGPDDDLVYGGSGDDKAYGDADNDQVYGNLGDDALYGGTGLDRIQGNEGVDTAFGGSGQDLVIGGTSKAGKADEGDFLYGDTGEDVLVGDNATADTIPAYAAELGSSDPDVAGTDYVYGGDGNDKAYGGLENDWVYGGKDDDDLEGNGGQDHVYGELGTDDLIGGSSEKAGVVSGQDVGRPDADDDLYGGDGDDVITGDNAVVTRTGTPTAITVGRPGVTPRGVQPLDLGRSPAPLTANYGGDRVYGENGPDVILGQGGEDTISAGGDDDYAEGDQAKDVITGGDGQDDLVGGSSYVQSGTAGQPWTRTGQLDTGDEIDGGDGQDVVLGDNGVVLRGVPASDITKNRGGMTGRLVDPYDLGDSLTPGTSGGDYLLGQGESDVILGQRGTDRIAGHAGQDYLEGGPESDWVEGGAGDDDLVGGSSAPLGGAEGPDALGQPDDDDWLWAQEGDDVAVGDNAAISRVEPFDPLTYRIGTNPVKERTEGRFLRLRDRVNSGSLLLADASRAGADFISGQAGVDVLLGQDENDQIAGGGADDYLEGQGGADKLYGDLFLSAAATPYAKSWPKDPTSMLYAADGTADGQDEVIGGKSEPKFRDGDDYVEGNGESDFVLGDNGSVQRDIQGAPGALVDRPYALKYDPSKALPLNAAKVRLAAGTNPSTRFCDEQQATCEPTGAFGADTIYGQGGDDFLYGQDGGDTIRGGAEDDDIYGELGEDFLFGESGKDAIVGDRGGVVDTFETGAREKSVEVTSVPKVVFRRFTAGTVTRVTDLAHDVNGDARVNGTFPWDGLRTGQRDEIRGGSGDDRIHAGLGDDLVNGDSGGDALFGDDGADVMWGGKGCDQQLPKAEQDKACFDPVTGVFQAAPHETGAGGKRQGETVPGVTDYLIGGTGGDENNGLLGADILDWNPRGAYSSPGTDTTCTDDRFPKDILASNKKAVAGTIDPCAWFRMTNKDTATLDDDQFHQGVDWQYGGWDRDVMQANEADNGPNEGDRLLDWNGAYNLFTHCNSAYGGYNDVRQHSPAWQSFLQLWVYGLGAGYGSGADSPESATSGKAAFRELALVYPGADNDHGSGKAFPGTPGHFDANAGCPAN